MKKVLLVLLMGSVGLNIYLMNVEVVIKDDLDNEMIMPMDDEISLAQSGIQKPAKKLAAKVECEPKIIEKIVYKEKAPEEKEEIEIKSSNKKAPMDIKEVHANWFAESNEFFENRLALTADQVASYYDLKTRREQEINGYIMPKMEESREQGQAVYMFTAEDTIAIGKINQRYLEKLKEAFGDIAYQEYQQFKSTYNQRLIHNDNSSYTIEF